jgi:hypothetical protein
MTDWSHQRANDKSRERLASLISTLTPIQLAIDLGEGCDASAGTLTICYATTPGVLDIP